MKKLQNIKVKVIPIVIGSLGTVNKGLQYGLEGLKISIVEIGQNIKNTGDLRFAVTQTPVENHQLTLM